MKQLFTILKREITVKIKSKAFYLFVVFSPILFLIPILFSLFNKSTLQSSNKEIVGIMGSVKIVNDTIDYRGFKFIYLSQNETNEFSSNKLNMNKYIGVLDLNNMNLNDGNSKRPIKFYMNESDLMTNQKCVKEVESFINQDFIYKLSKKINASDTISYQLANLKNVYPIVYNKSSVEKSKKTATSLAYVLGMLLYIIFILFNNNILKGVTEEKNNKLAEVLSIFVKPINLMLGKIIGLGIVSLIQLCLWIFCFYLYLNAISWFELHYLNDGAGGTSTSNISSSIESIKSLPLFNLVVYIPLFFILGFLLNGALTTIIAIFSSNKNSNYLMFIGNLLNILSIYFGMFAATNPESNIATIASYIPLFSYLTIPVLLPYNVLSPTHIITSISILIFSVILLLLLSSYVYKNSIVKK
jgi:ABC-2 type transport system permease protein